MDKKSNKVDRASNADRATSVLSATGSLSGGAAGGLVGALIGGPVGGIVGGGAGSLISLLSNIPAARRHRARTEQAQREIADKLSRQEGALEKLNDEQFKIIGECVLALNETVEREKIAYLQQIVDAAVDYGEYRSYESILLSRIIRDISGEEIKFLVENFSYATVNIFSWADAKDKSDKKLEELEQLRKRIAEENGLLLLPSDSKALVANGLLSLGVLVPDQLSLGVHKYKYSDIAFKLMVFLRVSNQNTGVYSE